MPGESPGRDWDALLKPPTIWEQRRTEQTAAAARRRSRMWSVLSMIVIGAVFLGWFSLVPWVIGVPDPWTWLSIAGWLVLLPMLMFIAVVILRPLERRFLGRYQGLSLES